MITNSLTAQNFNFSKIQRPNDGASFSSGNSATGHPAKWAPAAGDRSSISSEARGSESSGSGFGNLLQGLNGWGAGNSSQTPSPDTRSKTGAAAQSSGPSEAIKNVLASGQMPMGVINSVAQALNAGGMATAGALHSLLTWGVTERNKTGKIRPEFQEILHKALDFAKQTKAMSDEDISHYEQRIFGGGDSSGGDKAQGKGKGSGFIKGLPFARKLGQSA